MRIKRIVQTIIFVLVFVLMFGYVYKVLSWKDTSGDYSSSMKSFYELEEDVVDVIFLGSSHCYCSVNNSILWDEHGISSFSLAISGQDLASTYHCMVESLKTQSPEVVMIEMYGSVFEGYGVEGNMYRNTLSYKPSKNAYDAIKSIVPEGQEMIHMLRWPIIHTRYAELQKQDFQSRSTAYIGYQSDYNAKSVDEIVPYKGEPLETLGENREYWIQKIIDYAEEAQQPICFFVAPYPAPDYEQMRIKRAEQIARENNVPFINMIDMADWLHMDVNTDFLDWMHTNSYGAEKVTRYIGTYLKENYSLDNHYGDDRYRLWDEDFAARQHEKLNHQLKLTGDVTNYLNMIGNLDNYTVIVTTNGEYYRDGIDLSPGLGMVGIGSEFYNSSHTWIFQNQELIYSSPEQEAFYYMELGYEDMIVTSSQGQKNVTIDKKEYCVTDNGINIVVYDNVLETVADCVGFDAAREYATVR